MSDPPPNDSREPNGRQRLDGLHNWAVKRQIDLGKLLETALYVALAYTIIGVVYAGWNFELVGEVEAALKPGIPTFADLVAMGSVIVLWPLMMMGSLVCDNAFCGLL